MQDKVYYTYIVASRTHVLYIGVTSNLERRMHEHRSGKEQDLPRATFAIAWFGSSDSPIRLPL